MSERQHTGTHVIDGTPLTRRTVLRSGAAAAVLTAVPALVWPGTAAAATPGRAQPLRPAPNGGDAAPAIQQAIDAAASRGGGIVALGPGLFLVGSSLVMRSGVTLSGAGMERTVLADHPTLGAAPIVSVTGTVTSPVQRATLTSLTVRNGAGQVGAATFQQDGIVIDYAERVAIRACRITEIQGFYGLRAEHTAGLSITDCTFYRTTYAMIVLFPECDGITVDRTTFDTVLSTHYAISYMFATGYEKLNYGDYFVRNVTIEHCRFLNNPRWIGINTHGGENVVFRHNHVENVKYGVLCSPVDGIVAHPALSNIVIEHNTLLQGSAQESVAGVLIAGSEFTPATNITIAHNTIRGFGGLYNAYGSITIYRIDGARIEHNRIVDFSNYGVSMHPNSAVYDVKIRYNAIRNMATVAPGAAGKTGAIGALNNGVYGIEVAGNKLDADSDALATDWFLYAVGADQSWQIRPDNRIGRVKQAVPFANLEHLPILKSGMPRSGLQQRHGDIVYDQSWRPAWVVTSPSIGYGAQDTASVMMLVSMAVGSTTATVVPGGTYTATSLPPGMNIVIDGAGVNGAALRARVLINHGGPTVTLDRPAATTVDHAAVRFAALTLAPVRRRR